MSAFKKYLYGRTAAADGHVARQEKETLHSLPMMTMPSSAFSSSSHLPEDTRTLEHKRAQGEYSFWPPTLDTTATDFTNSIRALNVRSAMTMRTSLIEAFIRKTTSDSIHLGGGLKVQVVQDMASLAHCNKHHFAAFVAENGLVVVWDDVPKNLIARCERLEQALVYRVLPQEDSADMSSSKSFVEKPAHGVNVTVEEDGSEYYDQEAYAPVKPRRLMLNQSVHTGLTLTLVLVTFATSWRKLAVESSFDKTYIRWALILASFVQMWCSFFFFQIIITSIVQILGPVKQVSQNSRYYSGVGPLRLSRYHQQPLPHVTVQCPVYKEGLYSVIAPTIRSIKAAISTYEMQGGSASIFINDDGMQVISDEDARARQDFYNENGIGWVARPAHDPSGEHGTPFVRPGKFKKASNMNYAMWISCRVEDLLARIRRHTMWTQFDEANAYTDAVKTIIHQDQGRTWVDGNIRIGDYVLIIDSDTRVPEDCLLDAVSEMEQSPDVSVIQFSSGVLNVTTSYFEKGVTFFTNLIYSAIKFAVASGDVAPFMGHNAMIRWSALQDIGFECPIEGREKWWAETTVSEDFDLALRLQTEGYTVRFATYFGTGFKEGVSLTVYDELARWEKYAFGCSELLFNPFRNWPTKSPLTPILRRFLTSRVPLASKFTILGYMGTYFAIASSWLLILANYFLTGLAQLDTYYIDSFQIFLSCVVVFSALGNTALAIYRYRVSEKALLPALLEVYSWIPVLFIFLGGVSMHLSKAIVFHLFSININWGATAKEVADASFFDEMPKVVRRFKWTLVYCLMATALMVVGVLALPVFWRVDKFIAFFPLAVSVFCHFSLPLLLNPSLMRFTF
ncbi:hypothetical protein MBLNU457_1196t1 [Dothideomycetes sp. NU457]